ncbi:F-box domain protein [Aspergillus luchuensis]|uniref:F-box domain protein n=1 Tax=Aspergillus kawachii TaxID=1069201 RepID=A0A146FHU1_ASPKA|nr:F-box domain protein [Aspergillus luchuensis]
MARVVRGEGDSLQRRGQLLFRQGNYSDALAAFTEVRSRGPPRADVMSILDNRAATYIKLTQYDRALNDSRQMIRRDTKDGRVKEKASVKRLDPFDTLPLELAMMVLQYFNFRELA